MGKITLPTRMEIGQIKAGCQSYLCATLTGQFPAVLVAVIRVSALSSSFCANT